MKKRLIPGCTSLCLLALLFFMASCGQKNGSFVTVPVLIDHNRMLLDAEMKQADGTWRKVRLWVDSGNPVFTINANLLNDPGVIDTGRTGDTDLTGIVIPGLRIGGMKITDSMPAKIISQPYWLFSTMHCDGNLPSAILKKYDIVFDYPKREFTIAEPGSIKHKGIKSDAIIHPETGIVQIMAALNRDTLSFALDNGASYSFISGELLSEYTGRHPEWPVIKGTAGCANMWGWWPANEQRFTVVRITGMRWGDIELNDFGIAGVPAFGPEGPSLGEWYSGKTMLPVNGFLGANVLKQYRIGIDYRNKAVWFQKDSLFNEHDMDIAGISVRQLPDSAYQVVGVVEKRGKPVVEGLVTGDTIISVDGLDVKGETMGRVVDALRGTPGDVKTILISRNGSIIPVKASVLKLL